MAVPIVVNQPRLRRGTSAIAEKAPSRPTIITVRRVWKTISLSIGISEYPVSYQSSADSAQVSV